MSRLKLRASNRVNQTAKNAKFAKRTYWVFLPFLAFLAVQNVRRSKQDMRLFAHIVIAGCLLLGPCCVIASADGGRLVLMERQGDYRISVFTSPEPLRAGPVDISVLVQDTKTGQPVSDAHVNVSLTPRDKSNATIHAAATTAAATNKLLRAALVELPDPGWWDVEIDCIAEHGPAQVRFTMEAGRQLPRWLAVWPWFGWPVGVVLLFGVHRLLVWRKQAKSPR